MSPIATVLYEDAQIGPEFPLHRLVLRLVQDEFNGEAWRLIQSAEGIPPKGIDNILRDIRDTTLIAADGALFVLADRDRIVEHFNRQAGRAVLPPAASDDEIAGALRDACVQGPKPQVFLLRPNLEGLIAAMERCGPGLWPDVLRRAIQRKDRLARDQVLRGLSREAMRSVRDCVRQQQPGVDGLVRELGRTLTAIGGLG